MRIILYLEWILYWLLVLNVAAIIMTLVDKKRARHDRRRIPERHLMWVGAVGGAAGMLMTMLLIHHKTRHLKFMVGLPLMILAQVLLLGWVYLYCDFIYVVH